MPTVEKEQYPWLKRAGEGLNLPCSQRKWKGRDHTLPCVVTVIFIVVVGHWGVEWEGMGHGGSGPGLTQVQTQGPVQPATGPEPAKTGPAGPGPEILGLVRVQSQVQEGQDQTLDSLHLRHLGQWAPDLAPSQNQFYVILESSAHKHTDHL